MLPMESHIVVTLTSSHCTQQRRRGPKPKKRAGTATVTAQLSGDDRRLRVHAVGTAQQQRRMQVMLPAHPLLHTGQLLGQEERKYLEIYLLAYMGMGAYYSMYACADLTLTPS
eukprot:TRINITY_DN2989_c0_g2_i2.p2 TRINITY_DN2989_c0_g2~~TRINITY_DN2989_c0_g2_i2.p2  ORF type:complete len:113 (-),score=15.34 TRINITY_DN2989_c0_g2_i2:1002-1340(-)